MYNAKEHAFKRFNKKLKEDKLGNVIYLRGFEGYLIKWAIEAAVKKYVSQATADFDYVVLDSEEVTVDDIIDSCETFSMLSQKRIVWVRDYVLLKGNSAKGVSEADCKRLIEYLKSPNESTVIFFSSEKIRSKLSKSGRSKSPKLEQFLAKDAELYDFDNLDKRELGSFVSKEAKSLGIEIPKDCIGHLIDLSGYYNKESDYTLYNLKNDILKISWHCENGRVTREDVEAVVSRDEETFVFALLDAVSANNKEKAFRLLGNIVSDDPDAIYSLISLITGQIESMLSIRQMQERHCSDKEIEKVTGKSGFRLKNLSGFARKYSSKDLKRILLSIYETDTNIKSGLLKGQLALELFVAGI